MTEYVIPILLVLILLYCLIKRKNIYDIFVNGSKDAFPLIVSLFPYITAILLMSELFELSGLSKVFIRLLTPVFSLVGIPKELIKLIIIKPFSGSGSLALLSEILSAYGTNSYLSLCACCLYGSQETVFYISAVYFVKCKKKQATKGIVISLVACLISTIFCCLFCRLIVIH